MKRVVAVLLVVVLQAPASGQQTPGEANTDSNIREQAERYFDVIDRGDVKVLDGLLVEECLVLNASQARRWTWAWEMGVMPSASPNAGGT